MVPTFNTADEGREGRGSDQAFVNWWEKVCPGISAAPGCERDGGRVVLPQPEEAPVRVITAQDGVAAGPGVDSPGPLQPERGVALGHRYLWSWTPGTNEQRPLRHAEHAVICQLRVWAWHAVRFQELAHFGKFTMLSCVPLYHVPAL